MKKYTVSVPIYANYFVKVEADSESEAIEKAEKQFIPSLCCQCSDNIELGEFDESGTSEAYLDK